MFCEDITPATWRGSHVEVITSSWAKPGHPARLYRYACEAHRGELDGLDDIEPVEVPVLGDGVMTFERACEILGYDGPLEWMNERSRACLIRATIVLSDYWAKPIEGLAGVRWQIETFYWSAATRELCISIRCHLVRPPLMAASEFAPELPPNSPERHEKLDFGRRASPQESPANERRGGDSNPRYHLRGTTVFEGSGVGPLGAF